LYSKEEFEKKRAYNVAKLRYSMAHGLWDFVLSTLLLLPLGYLPATWRLAGTLLSRWGLPRGEVAQSVAWVLLQAGASLALSLPWSAYSTFVLEARHGFNKTTPRTFVLDALKSVLLGCVLLPPVVAGATLILQRSGAYVGLYLWLFLLLLALVMITVYPTLIAPLFNKFTPLEQGPLRCAAGGVGELLLTRAAPLSLLRKESERCPPGCPAAGRPSRGWPHRCLSP
jgi:STE24 endopeptidase